SGDRVVETQIERLEVVRWDGRLLFDRELGDRLTRVSVVVNDLRDREPHAQQVCAVLRRGDADGLCIQELRLQRCGQLIEEHRDAPLELERRWPRCHACADSSATSRDDLLPVCGHERAQHVTSREKMFQRTMSTTLV